MGTFRKKGFWSAFTGTGGAFRLDTQEDTENTLGHFISPGAGNQPHPTWRDDLRRARQKLFLIFCALLALLWVLFSFIDL